MPETDPSWRFGKYFTRNAEVYQILIYQGAGLELLMMLWTYYSSVWRL